MKSLVTIAGFVSTVAAHGAITGINIDGKDYQAFNVHTPVSSRPTVIQWSATNTDHGFVDPPMYNTPQIVCHRNSAPGNDTADAMPGSKIRWQWTGWPGGHHGPVITYMANCNGPCETVGKTKLEFFKIDEKGMNAFGPKKGKAGDWASDDLRRAGNSWVSTIPSDLAPGNYVVRHEIIALHFGNVLNGAQNFPMCINVKVGGSGTAKPAGVKATALYKATDPGIYYDVYSSRDEYIIPGPPLYESTQGGSVAPPPAAIKAAQTSASKTVQPPAPKTKAPATQTDAPSPKSTDAPATATATPTHHPKHHDPKPTGDLASPTTVPTDAADTYPPATDGPSPTSAPSAPDTSTTDTQGGSPPPGTTIADLVRWILEALQTMGAKPPGSAKVRRHAKHYVL